MSAEAPLDIQEGGPQLVRRQIGQLEVIEVHIVDLDSLAAAAAHREHAAGFGTFWLGVLVSVGTSAAAGGAQTEMGLFGHLGFGVPALALSFWFGLQWWRARTDANALLDRVKRSANMTSKHAIERPH